MIQYRHGTWGCWFAWRVKGSVFPRAAVIAVPCASLSVLLHYAFHNFEMKSEGDAGTNILGGFSFVLGFLIVFRLLGITSARWSRALHRRVRTMRGRGTRVSRCGCRQLQATEPEAAKKREQEDKLQSRQKGGNHREERKILMGQCKLAEE